MDVILNIADHYFFTPYVYPNWLSEENIWRQFVTLNILVNIGGALLYVITASLSYQFLFDRRLLKHPQILKDQVKLEIEYTLKSVPGMGFLTALCFLAEVNGFSKLYDDVEESKFGWYAILGSVISFILFTDCCIYWIHRGLHTKYMYKYFHKPHHKWKIPTPFASHAFHPIDGFVQSLPYHVYVFLFPMHKFTYLFLFVFVNVWTVSIHDGDYRVPELLKPYVNGSAHHTDHHVYYNYNYGQYFTLWDRIGGSFRNPSSFEGCGPVDEVLKREAAAGGDGEKNSLKNGVNGASKKIK